MAQDAAIKFVLGGGGSLRKMHLELLNIVKKNLKPLICGKVVIWRSRDFLSQADFKSCMAFDWQVS